MPELDAEIEWVSNLEERVTRVSSRWIEEDQVLCAAGKARPGEEEEEEVEAKGEGSSDEMREGYAMEKTLGLILPGPK